MPKAVRIKGGVKVINKRTGKIMHVYRGKDAKSKAAKVVRAGY